VAADDLPLVSIVTPSLNQGAYIEEAIRSVSQQDYPSVEHIVVDGGSTDETLDVLRRHPHLTWVSEPDRGQADAVNKGFAMASGFVFGWLNADDFYLSGAIATAVDVLRTTGCGLVHGGWRRVDERGRTIKDVAPFPFDYARQLEVANGVAQPGAFFTREAFETVGGLDISYRYAMDYELWLKLGARFDVRHVDAILAAYRYHSTSKTVAEPVGFVAETVRASRAHGGRRLSPMYLDYYLPRHRPWVYRALIALRLIRAADLKGLGRRIAARSSWGRPRRS
jgi:glycosyltransferase involved in cell wall biosynthesis